MATMLSDTFLGHVDTMLRYIINYCACHTRNRVWHALASASFFHHLESSSTTTMMIAALPQILVSDVEYRHAAIPGAFASLLASNGIHEALQLGMI